VVQRSPGREVAPGLPEHVKIAADRLSLAAVDGDHHRDSANAGCESEPAGAPRSGDYGEAAGQTQELTGGGFSALLFSDSSSLSAARTAVA